MLHAIAFHESVSIAKLEELFHSEMNQVFAGTMACECPKCHTRFAVFFPNGEDPDNQQYLATIAERIAADCSSGKHYAETTV